ncbi:MAG: hypothetical protein COS94_01785 [Candidatus Hydrogenedentes bacterium CG07_land_8_20_14_0_80_42_17]|nr:MAG: hypothetical protein COS94_01785 [Candidatus Hydrogenedentes bacterium CG07_land_8_20_14_0_80_42_17]
MLTVCAVCEKYYSRIRPMNHKFDLRDHMVRYALVNSLRATAHHFSCSRNTVAKWVHRWKAEGMSGLQKRSRAPKSYERIDEPFNQILNSCIKKR